MEFIEEVAIAALILIITFVIIPRISAAIARGLIANERDEVKEMIREIKQYLLDGGGKEANETQAAGEQQLNQMMELKFKEVMENMERSSSRAVINPWDIENTYKWTPSQQRENRNSPEELDPRPLSILRRGRQSKS